MVPYQIAFRGEHMGRAINEKRAFSSSETFSETSQEQAAEYIYHLLTSVQKISENKELTLLARLVGLAKDEAKKHF